mmetsp:Transcript_28488/g.75205  ORF Transcript_28488/g.75205 Transcript_28488/m.75205 type:complete len:90 (-) Transcript_28488:19-288(-)
MLTTTTSGALSMHVPFELALPAQSVGGRQTVIDAGAWRDPCSGHGLAKLEAGARNPSNQVAMFNGEQMVRCLEGGNGHGPTAPRRQRDR